ncbi:MAG: glucose-6-phosphate isomerase [Deltaproteobacteria bacterium]|nr:glucose-6-phosphate isomerase [Deltaproteobacteria bacterium]
MIRFDFSGVTKELINERGISKEDINALSPIIKEAHDILSSRRERGEILFYDLPYAKDTINQVKDLAGDLSGKFKNIVHLGIGGSSLGPKAIFSALKDPFHNYVSSPRMFFLENIDPEYIASLLDNISAEETLFNVVSKSGATPETASQFMVVFDLLKTRLGKNYKDHLVFITDPKDGVLRRLASAHGIRSLPIPKEVGGRFSVLTPVGLLPAAMCSIDIDKLLDGAAKMADIVTSPDVFKNPAYMYACIHFIAFVKGINISVIMPYSNALYDLADWYRQLWAESLGKKTSLDNKDVFTGQTPVKALGATDQHSQIQLYMEGPFDKIINIITVKHYRKDIKIPAIFNDINELAYLGSKDMSELINAEASSIRAALIKNERPTTQIEIDTINGETIGALFMFFEVSTAFMGYLLKIDPFNQPGVELGKQLTFSLMGRPGFEDKVKMLKDSLKTVEYMHIEI